MEPTCSPVRAFGEEPQLFAFSRAKTTSSRSCCRRAAALLSDATPL